MKLDVDQLSNKRLSFNWNDPMHTTEVNVELPDLSQLTMTSWGDWGPMYSFSLKPETQIKISYNDVSYILEAKKLAIDSPIYADVRKEHPFIVRLEDKFKDLNFDLFLNKDYEVGMFIVRRASDNVELANSENQFSQSYVS